MNQRFGGQRQGGISTPAKVPVVFLIAGDSGKQHGYPDEWTDDGIFLYTGEGQHGDMKFVGGNRAIRDHQKNGKALHVFELVKRINVFFATLGSWNTRETPIGIYPILEASKEEQLYFTFARLAHWRPTQRL